MKGIAEFFGPEGIAIHLSQSPTYGQQHSFAEVPATSHHKATVAWKSRIASSEPLRQ